MPTDLCESSATADPVERLLAQLPGARRAAAGGPAEIELPRLPAGSLAELAAAGIGLVQSRPLDAVGTLHVLAGPGPRRVRVLATAETRSAVTSGALVVLMGPDGCGKSTLARRMVEAWRPVLGTTAPFHLRPRLGPRTKRALSVADDPHGAEPRGAVMSLAKLGFLLADYQLGYRASVRPILRAGGLALFDRYAFDLLADPLRFRYGGPRSAARLLARLVRRPDLVMLLDAPAEVLHARKPELPVETLEALRRSFRETLGGGAVLLDAGHGPGRLALDADRALIEHLHRRNARAPAGDGG